MRWSSGCSGSRRNSVERLRSGGLTSKNGFSVVAPISTSVPSSTAGSRASCCDLLKRWISSRNRIVPCPRSPSRWRARSMTSRTSLTPAVTADSCSNARDVVPATASASVVLPVPGRSPQQHRRQPVLLDEASQRAARPEQLRLADDVVDGARAQPGGEWRLGAQAVLGDGREQVVRHRRRTRRATVDIRS